MRNISGKNAGSPPSREDKTKQTVSRILEEALDLFLTRDYHSVSTKEIAERANVAKGTIFHHFETKLGLGIAVMDYLFEDLLKQIEQIKSKFKDDLAEGFTHITSFFLKMITETPSFTQLLLQLMVEIDRDRMKGEVSKKMIFVEKELVPYYNEFMEIFRELGYGQPLVQARIYFAILDGLSFQFYLEDIQHDDQIFTDLVEEINHIFLNRRN